MELTQLKYFIEVAKCQHITRAAEKLYITQPTMSKTISTLEKNVGFPLFNRNKNHITLSKAGEVFYEHVLKAMDELELGLQEGKEIYKSQQPEIPVVSNVTWFLDIIIERYAVLPTAIHTKRAVVPYASVVKELVNKKLPFAFLTEPVQGPQMSWTPLISEELFVVSALRQPEAKNGLIDLAALKDQPFVGPKPDMDWRKITDEFCRSAGFRQNVVFDNLPIPHLYGLLKKMSANILAPTHNVSRYYRDQLKQAEPEDSGLCCVYRVVEPHCRVNTGLVRNMEMELTPAQESFLELARSVFANAEEDNRAFIEKEFPTPAEMAKSDKEPLL